MTRQLERVALAALMRVLVDTRVDEYTNAAELNRIARQLLDALLSAGVID